MDTKLEKSIMRQLTKLSNRVVYFTILLILILNYAQAQNSNKLKCIQGVWRGTNMDIEPFQDISNFYQIIQGDSIISFYLNEEDIFVSHFKFINFNILEEDVDFYNVEKSNILSLSENNDEIFIYTEIDQHGNVAIDKYFSCGTTSLNKLHMEFQKDDFVTYSVYSFFKTNYSSYINQLNLINKLIKAEIIVDKTYFHKNPDENSKFKAFVIKGDQVIIDKINGDWIKVAYEGKKITTEGWIKRSDLDFLN